MYYHWPANVTSPTKDYNVLPKIGWIGSVRYSFHWYETFMVLLIRWDQCQWKMLAHADNRDRCFEQCVIISMIIYSTVDIHQNKNFFKGREKCVC